MNHLHHIYKLCLCFVNNLNKLIVNLIRTFICFILRAYVERAHISIQIENLSFNLYLHTIMSIDDTLTRQLFYTDRNSQ